MHMVINLRVPQKTDSFLTNGEHTNFSRKIPLYAVSFATLFTVNRSRVWKPGLRDEEPVANGLSYGIAVTCSTSCYP
jgi:hypothetical protein